MSHYTCTLAALLVVAPISVHAEDASPRYAPIPVEGNFATLFKERLQTAKDDAPLRKLWNDFQRSPNKFNFDPALFDQFDLKNPALHSMLKGLMEKHQSGAPLGPHDLDGLKKVLQDIKSPGRAGSSPTLPSGSVQDVPLPTPPSDVANIADQPRPDLLDRWMRDWANHAEDTKLGEWLRQSPAFQKGLGDLRTLIDFKSNPLPWGLDILPAHLRLTDNLNLGLGNGLLSGLKNFSVPELPRVSLPHMNLPHISLGNWSAPTLPLPHLGGLSGAHVGQPLLWAVLVGAGVLLVWQVVKNIGPRSHRQTTLANLGPWPVDPAQIATRGQLIQACDYLALLMFGAEARTWNHRAIARRMLEADLQPGAVEELANLYETARYTTGPEMLDANERAAIRHHLCLLAEVPAS